MSAALKRLLRVAVTVVFAGVVAEYGNSPYYLALAPAISALGKFLRAKYGWTWLPF